MSIEMTVVCDGCSAIMAAVRADAAQAALSRVADDLLTDWATELGADDVRAVHEWINSYAAIAGAGEPATDEGGAT